MKSCAFNLLSLDGKLQIEGEFPSAAPERAPDTEEVSPLAGRGRGV